jgi:type II secretory pathway component PulF
VDEGQSLSAALDHHRAVLSPAYCALVEAGEESGRLAGALLLFAEQGRTFAQVRRSVVSAVLYPSGILLLTSLLLTIISTAILAPMLSIYGEMGFSDDMGFVRRPTALVLAELVMPILKFAPVVFFHLAVAGWIVAGIAARGVVTSPRICRWMLFIPVMGRLLKSVAMIRFCRLLGGALKAGVPLPRAISLAGNASSNACARQAAERLRLSIEEGEEMATSMDDPIFPLPLRWMLGLGEARGDLTPVLDEYVRLQELELERATKTLPALTSALAMCLAAAGLALAAILVFAPMYTLLTI